jgi:ABC-type sulfate transport system permease component
VAGALRRSAELVKGSWWRVFGILLLVLLIVLIISQVISVPFSLPFFLVGDQPSDSEFLLTLVITALGGIVASTITAPFTAAATVLLYVDRRIRREGLDIDLARAAGVTIPGRTDAGPPAPPAPRAP